MSDLEPGSVFRALRDRPTPELDGDAAWRRLRARLGETSRDDLQIAWWRRLIPAPGARLAWGAAAAAALAFVVWLAPGAAPVGVPAAPEREPVAPLVLLADDPVATAQADELAATPAGVASLDLEVRLVRSYGKTRPADALPEATAGAGGARPLRDIDTTLRALVPGRDFAIVGAWKGALLGGALEAPLSPRLQMLFEARRDDEGIRLSGVQLLGDVTGQTGELLMQPDRVYVLGVEVPGESEALLLVLRLRERPQPDEPRE